VKSAVETLNPTRVRLTVEVPFEELKDSLDAAYKKIAQQINVPGFRKGKVPPMVIDRQIGRGPVLDEAINEALPKLYVQALQDNDIEPLAQPEIDITKFEDNDSLEFTAEVDVRPQITLPDLEGVEVTVDDVEALTADTRPASVFAVTNAIDRREPAAAATALRRALDEGCCKLTLEVLDANTRARDLYQSVGFEDYALGDHASTRFLAKSLEP